MAQRGDDHTWRTGRLRDLLNSERHNDTGQQRRALEALEQEMSERSATGGLATLDRRRRDFDTLARDHESVPPHNRAAILHATRRAFASSQRLARLRETYTDTARAEPTDPSASTRRATPPFGYSEAFTDHYLNTAHEEREQRYRAKRRKLDDGTFDDETKGVRYGDKGRVTPGPLSMQVVNHDGGHPDEPHRGMAQYVLQDDSAVYSTKGNGCNILLKHSGGTPFSLTKIVFKAPTDGYDAPMQEGMVFVAMDDEGLFERTSQYEIKDVPKPYRRSRRADLYRRSEEYLNSTRPPLRAIDRARSSRESTTHYPRLQTDDTVSHIERSITEGFEISYADPSDSEDVLPQGPLSPYRWRGEDAFRSGRSYADRYRPVYNDELSSAELSGTSDDSEDLDSEPVLRYPTEALPVSYLNERRDRREQTLGRTRVRRSSNRVRNSYAWLRRYYPDSDFNFAESAERGYLARTESGSSESGRQAHESDTLHLSDAAKLSTERHSAVTDQSAVGDVLVPYAHFYIHRHKSSIVVNFDPPVSGRYIFLKLWSAWPSSTTAIQSIIAHGYGGPRFFPAQDLR